MKKIIILTLALVSILFDSYSQTLEFAPSSPVFKEKNQDTVYYVTVKVNPVPAHGTFRIATSKTDLDATYIRDYELLNRRITDTIRLDSASSRFVSIGIIVKADAYNTEGNEQFRLFFTYDSAAITKRDSLTVTIKDAKPDEVSFPDTAKWNVRIVTGSNFDFFEAPVFKNFAGDLNIFLPNLKKLKLFGTPTAVGINAGVFNYRYYDSDSSGSNIITENYLVNPTIRTLIPDTTKYIREIYAVNSKQTYNNWGFYLNPILTITNDTWFDLYFEGHFEGIWRTRITTFSQVVQRKDTFTVTKTDTFQRAVFQSFKGIRSLYQKDSYFDFYAGIGFPLKVNIKKAFEFFVSPSFGISSYGSTVIDLQERSSIRSRTFEKVKTFQPYFLTKFQLTTTVAPVDITFGGEFRSIFNKDSFLGMYLGAALSLDKLKR